MADKDKSAADIHVSSWKKLMGIADEPETKEQRRARMDKEEEERRIAAGMKKRPSDVILNKPGRPSDVLRK